VLNKTEHFSLKRVMSWPLDLFQALLDVLQQEQPELTEAASTMTQQQRENWLQQINSKISSLDQGIAQFILLSLQLSCGRHEHSLHFKTESTRKLSNQWTKTLYQNNLKFIAFFFTLFKSYRRN